MSENDFSGNGMKEETLEKDYAIPGARKILIVLTIIK